MCLKKSNIHTAPPLAVILIPDLIGCVSPVGHRGHLTLVHVLLHERVGVGELVALSTLNKAETRSFRKQTRNRRGLRAGASLCVLTMRKHCWLKLWLMYVASIARFRGELKELPSSCGGSLAVSLTVSKSEGRR